MLDLQIDKMFSIEAILPSKTGGVPKVLLLRACKITIFGKGQIYSELDEQTFDVLNENSGCGALDIELVFDNNIVKECYPKFYTKCFVMRTDTKVSIKPMKFRNSSNCSKINQNGELVIGVRYFFRDKIEIDKIMQCGELMIEGFIAIGKPTNVFGIMCQLRKEETGWEITSAYTYKPEYAKNIKNLMD